MDEQLKRHIAERMVELFQMVPDERTPTVAQLVAAIDTGNSDDIDQEFRQKVKRVLTDPTIDWDAVQQILDTRAPDES